MKPGDSQGREQRERKEIDRGGILIEVILCFCGYNRLESFPFSFFILLFDFLF